MPSHILVYVTAGVALVTIGLIGTVLCRHVLRRILAVNLLGAGIFLLLIALANRRPGPAPDPVPHAMVLTGIVVAVSATALALALARRAAAVPREQDGESTTSEDG